MLFHAKMVNIVAKRTFPQNLQYISMLSQLDRTIARGEIQPQGNGVILAEVEWRLLQLRT